MKIRSPLLAAMMVAGIMGATAQQAQAGAIAQAYLNITGLTVSFSTAPDSIGTVVNTTDASTSYNGAPASSDSDPSLSHVFQGPDGALYAPGVAYPNNPPTDDFTGAHADIAGSLLAPTGASSLVDSTVVLANPAEGTAQANSGVTASITFDFEVGETSTLTLAFMADAFLISDLDQPNLSSQANITWVFSLTNLDTGQEFEYAPTELTENVSVNSTTGTDSYTLALTPFGTSFDLGAGTWQGQIRHSTVADAEWAAVPEPGSLALLGLGMLGLGAVRRRK